MDKQHTIEQQSRTRTRPRTAAKALSVAALLTLITGNLRFSQHRGLQALGVDIDYAFTQEDDITRRRSDKKFYIIPTPEVTDWLLGNHTQEAFDYYENALNEDQAELWLHRSLQEHPSRTLNPDTADVFVICGCLHFNYYFENKLHPDQNGGKRRRQKQRRKHPQSTVLTSSANNIDESSNATTRFFTVKEFAAKVADRVIDKDKPHLLALPTTNPSTSRWIGIKAIVKALKDVGVNSNHLYSLGFERNQYWQGGISPERIIPIPYVVKPPHQHQEEEEQEYNHAAWFQPPNDNSAAATTTITKRERISNFVFYSGDRRIHALEWSGCDRSMVEPLMGEENMDVRLIDSRCSANHNETRQQQEVTSSSVANIRLTQQEYNERMYTSDYCLILCGDSPTSRSLTSAIIHGCIPLRIGSRLRGLCEPPCHQGWGWTIPGEEYPHLIYTDHMDWTRFPEVDEAAFTANPKSTLQQQVLEKTSMDQKEELRSIMAQHRDGFIYGWGNPVNSNRFGKAIEYIWDSVEATLVIRQRGDMVQEQEQQ